MKNVRINDAAKFYCSPDWSWDTAETNWLDYDLWIVLDGKGFMIRNLEEIFDIGPGDCFLLRCDDRYLCSHKPDQPLTVACIHFDYLDEQGNVCRPDTSLLPPLYRHLGNISFIGELCSRVISSFRSSSSAPGECEIWLQAILFEIKNHQPIKNVTYGQIAMIDSVCEKILKNPGQHYPIAELAGEYSYSTDHFTRIFKKLKQTSPQDFIINARISTAKSLLCNSNHSITRIAELTGYNDTAHFSRQFHQRTGVTPSQCRKPVKYINELSH